MEIQSLLLPTDFSKPSFQAAEFCFGLAERFKATVHILHVIEDPIPWIPMFASFAPPSREELETFGQQELENWVLPDSAANCTVERHLIHGTPYVEIVRFARTRQIDHIVLGTHGRGMLSHVLIGGVADKVVRKAPCPVTTIRPKDFEFVAP